MRDRAIAARAAKRDGQRTEPAWLRSETAYTKNALALPIGAFLGGGDVDVPRLDMSKKQN